MAERSLMLLLGTVAWCIFVSVSAANILVGLLAQLVALPFDRERRVSLFVNRIFWGRLLFMLEPTFPILRRGLHQVGPGPYVVVCNHSSVLDIPSCLGLRTPLRVVGKTSLFKVPFMGWWMSFCRQIPLDGSSPESVERFLERAVSSLEAGISVLVFPEGSRSVDGSLAPFHRGAFRLAKDTGTAVLPVAVLGTREVLGKGALWLGSPFTMIRLRVMPSLDPAAHSTARKLSNRAREAVASGLDQLRAEAS